MTCFDIMTASVRQQPCMSCFHCTGHIFRLSPKTDSTPPSDNSDSDSDSDSDDSDDKDECAQKSLRKQIMELPDSRNSLADAVDKKFRVLLDSVIEVPLPGISRQHDLLFLQRLLRQLSGVDIDQNTPRPAWMALVRAHYSLKAQPEGAALAVVHIWCRTSSLSLPCHVMLGMASEYASRSCCACSDL
jgi:hypothetical protein